MNNRLKSTRVVVFKNDYVSNGGKVLYAKGIEHAIHYKTVEKLEARGVSMKVSEFESKRIDAAKQKFEESKKS